MEFLGKLKNLNSKDIEKSVFAVGFECADRELFKPEKCYDFAAEAGVKLARLSSGWARTEKEKGVYDFGWLDDMVNSLLERKIQPWFNVVYGNPLYMPDAPNPNASGCTPMRYKDDAKIAWFKYVKALVLHFKDRVIHYEIWNEANSPLFWHPGEEDMTEFAKFYNLTAELIRDINSDVKIGTNLDGRAFRDPKWYYEFFPRIKSENMDFFCFHAYELRPEYLFYEDLYHLRAIMDENGLKKTEIWQGEAGFPSWFVKNHSMNPTSQSNEHRQAVAVLRRMVLDSSENLNISNIYHMTDLWEGKYSLPGLTFEKDTAWGLLNGKVYTPKESYKTYSNIATLLSGEIHCKSHTRPVNEFDADIFPTKALRFCYIKNNKPLYAYYLPTDIEQDIPTKNGFVFELEKNELPPENCILIDALTGDVYRITSEFQNGKTVFKDLPLAEYPFISCDANMIEIQ